MSSKIKEITIGATIPTASYANISTQFVIEVDGDVEEAKKMGIEHIVALSKEYAEPGRELESKAQLDPKAEMELEKVTSPLTDGVAYRDKDHHFWTASGERYLSASRFASKFVKPFPKAAILPKMVSAYGGTVEEHEAIWSLKGDVSTLFGKAVHAGIELYGRHNEMGAKTGAKDGTNKALTDQPHVKKIVEDLFGSQAPTSKVTFKDEDAMYEVQVIDESNKRIAEIDRLKVVDREKKIVRVQDFKTNFDVNAEEKLLAPFNTMPKTQLSKYWLQLSFEAEILKKAGYTVEGLDIFHLTADGWVTYSSDVIDLTKALEL